MWLKLKSKVYVNFETGAELGAQLLGNGTAQVWANTPKGANVQVMGGYATQEDAQNALDDLMNDTGFGELEDPNPELEDQSEEDDNEESEEDATYEDNYDLISDEDLRAELSTRELSTRGSAKQMIARLRRDDQKRETETDIAIS